MDDFKTKWYLDDRCRCFLVEPSDGGCSIIKEITWKCERLHDVDHSWYDCPICKALWLEENPKDAGLYEELHVVPARLLRKL